MEKTTMSVQELSAQMRSRSLIYVGTPFSRIVADVAPPVDEDLDYFESQGSILSCLLAGGIFKEIKPSVILPIVGIVKRSAIVGTGEPAMLERRRLK